MVGLNGFKGRLARLERAAPRVEPGGRCAGCGLAHVPPQVPLATVEAIVGAALGTRPRTVAPLCWCDCCAERREIAVLTHGRGIGP